MKWDEAIVALLAALRADTALRTLLGTDYLSRIKRGSDSAAPLFPSITYRIISSPLNESTEDMLVQWDIWTRGTATSGAFAVAVAIEERVRAVMHRDTVTTIGGIAMWARLDDARDHDDPESGVVHRSLDFAYEFAKEATT